jgi:hypothetical protein
MIPEDHLAAIAAALTALRHPEVLAESDESRWKVAARRPELELEEIRAIH